MRRTLKILFVVLPAWLAVATGSAVLAQDPFNGRFDAAHPIYVSGTIAEVSFGYPHPIVGLKLTGAAPPSGEIAGLDDIGLPIASNVSPIGEGIGGVVRLELPSVPIFRVVEGRIRLGETFAAIVLRNCKPPYQLRAQWIRLSSGTSVTRVGRMQTEVAGC